MLSDHGPIQAPGGRAPTANGAPLDPIAYFCTMNNWISVTEKEDFYTLLENSTERPQIIFKDSLTCGISAHAKHKLQSGFGLIEGKADFHYLDLLAFRPVSNLISQELQVTHQSPQIILVKDKRVVYTTSHHAIDPAVIARHLS